MPVASSLSRHPMRDAVLSGLKTSCWLLSIMIPISFCVTLLQHFEYLSVIAGWLEPFCRTVGLRGEAALVWVTAGTMNIYSGIAVIQSIPFSAREITIMALMTLIAHSLIVETLVQRKTGTPAWSMLVVRLTAAWISGALLNWLLPETGELTSARVATVAMPFPDVMRNWLTGTMLLSLKIICIIVSLNILQQFMQEYGLMDRMAAWCAPVMKVMGLAPQASFLWIVANTIGLSYGASVILNCQVQQTLSRRDTDLLNSHIAVCHSLLEDTPMFLAVQANLFWITVPRILLAVAIVWFLKLILALRQKRSA